VNSKKSLPSLEALVVKRSGTSALSEVSHRGKATQGEEPRKGSQGGAGNLGCNRRVVSGLVPKEAKDRKKARRKKQAPGKNRTRRERRRKCRRVIGLGTLLLVPQKEVVPREALISGAGKPGVKRVSKRGCGPGAIKTQSS